MNTLHLISLVSSLLLHTTSPAVVPTVALVTRQEVADVRLEVVSPHPVALQSCLFPLDGDQTLVVAAIRNPGQQELAEFQATVRTESGDVRIERGFQPLAAGAETTMAVRLPSETQMYTPPVSRDDDDNAYSAAPATCTATQGDE